MYTVKERDFFPYKIQQTFNFNEILICKCQKKYICCLNIMWIQSNLPKMAPVYNKSLSIESSLIFPINE
jgi:hypothetical protein